MQLERGSVDMIVENMMKVINSIINEITQIHKDSGIDIDKCPDVKATL
mgnify:CR=1 FL=1